MRLVAELGQGYSSLPPVTLWIFCCFLSAALSLLAFTVASGSASECTLPTSLCFHPDSLGLLMSASPRAPWLQGSGYNCACESENRWAGSWVQVVSSPSRTWGRARDSQTS